MKEKLVLVEFLQLIPVYLLSVVLRLDKGDFPVNLLTVSVSKINKRSFEPFCVWIFFQNASSHSVSDLFIFRSRTL